MVRRKFHSPRGVAEAVAVLRRGVVRGVARGGSRRRGASQVLAVAALGCAATCVVERTRATEPVAAASASASIAAERMTERINARTAESWQENGVRPAAAATDEQWCRRTFLDVVGRIPTMAELDAFLADRPAERRAALADRLLGEGYREAYARHWASQWTNVLIGRTGGMSAESLTRRDGLRTYLEACFVANRSYDRMAYELITATGSTDPEAADFHGAVNFLVEKLGDGGVQATAKTAQIFLGMAVQCTQCHNHPFNEYRQNQFWELNAFFRQARVVVAETEGDGGPRRATLSDVDFAGEAVAGGNRPRFDERREVFLELRDGKLVDRDAAETYAAPIFYELRNGQLQIAFPAFVDGVSLAERLRQRGSAFGNSGALAHVHRRRELAELTISSEHFAPAAVNRIWACFFGLGFTKPVDDMGPHNPPSHPELLAELADAWRSNGYDLRELIRSIVLSEPYALGSRLNRGNAADDPAQGRPPLFSRFYLRQMTAEQLYESLLAATAADAAVAADRREAEKSRWLGQFSTAFGNDEGVESTTFNGSIPQTLALMNGDLMERACSLDSGSFLDRVASDAALTERQKIDFLYRAALGRVPTREERVVCNELLALRQGDVSETLQDVWWAVLNSNEFLLIH